MVAEQRVTHTLDSQLRGHSAEHGIVVENWKLWHGRARYVSLAPG
jgi:hypothetical protein